MDSKERLIDYWSSRMLITDKRLLDAFKKVPREKFILSGYVREAYGDYPLPIGEGQTISQPTTVMMMTQALELKPGNKVLEIGAGSGYQAAIIARMVGSKGRVITTEIIPDLAKFAVRNLRAANIKNVKVVDWDGSQGYDKEAPYDRIIVTAACPKIPQPLIDQLKDGGIIVAPVGPAYGQRMIKAVKVKGTLKKKSLGAFMFVPLQGKYGY
jgi:protein-L-isoaspartate(D-aspartate) O-methyltransferase